MLASLVGLAACGGVRDDLSVRPDPIGQFLPGHLVAVTNEPTRGPFFRRVEDAAWTEAMQTGLIDPLRRCQGDRLFHVGVAVEGYVLVLTGVLPVYSPQSALIFLVNLYEDATRERLNKEPIHLTVFPPCGGVRFVPSGVTETAEEQMDGLAFNAARTTERMMRENAHRFGGADEMLAGDATILKATSSSITPGRWPRWRPGRARAASA